MCKCDTCVFSSVCDYTDKFTTYANKCMDYVTIETELDIDDMYEDYLTRTFKI